VPRVIPKVEYYSEAYGEGQKTLKRVLNSLSVYHEDLEYFNGLGFVASIFLLYLNEEDTFWMVNYILDNSMISGWINQDQTKISLSNYIYQKLLLQHLPEVYNHLTEKGIYP